MLTSYSANMFDKVVGLSRHCSSILPLAILAQSTVYIHRINETKVGGDMV